MLAAWGVCIERYARVGGGSYNNGIFVPLLLLALALTTVAGFVSLEVWQGRSRAVTAAAVAVPAVVFILVLALAIGLRG